MLRRADVFSVIGPALAELAAGSAAVLESRARGP